MVLHNLACGQWWHMEKYNFIEESMVDIQEKEEFNSAFEDFKSCVANFCNSIAAVEGLNEPFKIGKNSPGNINSCLSLMNIGEVFIQNQQYEVGVMQLAMMWLKEAIQIYAKVDKRQVGRALTLLAVTMRYLGKLENAEDAFIKALKVLNGVSFIQKNNFDEFIALKSYGFTLKKNGKLEKANELEEKADKIQPTLFYWSEKLNQLHVPMWHL